MALFAICGCTSGPVPKWDGKIWAGKSKYTGIIFTKEDGTNDIIRADDPQFDAFIAMTYKDLTKFLATYVQGCKTWKPGMKMMTAQEALRQFQFVTEEWKAEVDER